MYAVLFQPPASKHDMMAWPKTYICVGTCFIILPATFGSIADFTLPALEYRCGVQAFALAHRDYEHIKEYEGHPQGRESLVLYAW